MKSNLIELNDNPDITAERQSATFAVNDMAAFIHGGEEIIKRRHEILEFVNSCPEFRENVPLEFLSREKRYEMQARKAVAMTNLATDVVDGSDFFGEGMYYQRFYTLKYLDYNKIIIFVNTFSLIMGRDLHAMSLHYVMFLPTLQGQATDEQLDKWLGLVG